MNFVFKLERVICTPSQDLDSVAYCKPLGNVVEFMWWLQNEGHNITIWSERPNSLDYKLATEEWLKLHQIPYGRLLFDRPTNPIFVDDTPPEAQYFKTRNGDNDNDIIAYLFDEWKKVVKNTEIKNG